MAHDREVLRGVASANSAVVLAEHDIEHPVQLVLNSPMRTGGFERRLGSEALA